MRSGRGRGISTPTLSSRLRATASSLPFPVLLLIGAIALAGCAEGPYLTADPEPEAEIVVLAGGEIEGVVGETSEQIVVQLLDLSGAPIAGAPVRFEVAPGGGEVSPELTRTDFEGIARAQWTLGPLAGEQRVDVVLASSGAPVGMISAEASPGPAYEISVFPEAATIRAGVPFELDAQVRDAYGNQIASVPMAWSSEDDAIATVDPDGRVTGLAIGATAIEVMLHEDAATSHPGVYELLAPGSAPQEHHRPGHSGGRSQVEVVDGEDEAYVTATSGDGQVGMPGERLDNPLGVRVVDAEGAPLRQVAVEWRVESGGGSVSQTSTRTNGSGRASVEWTLGSSTGSQRVQARVGDLGSVTFTATALDGSSGGSDSDDGSGGGSDDGSGGGSGEEDSAGSPAGVTDLRVHETGEGSATLRFTQVDDGNGGAANYQVRFASHPIGWGWGSASQVSKGSCEGEIEGTRAGSSLTCTVEGLGSGHEYDFQLISYRGLISDGSRVYGELSNVATGVTESASSREGDSGGGDSGDSGDGGSGGGSSTITYSKEASGNSLIAWSPMSEMFKWGAQALSNGYGAWWQWQEGDPNSTIRSGSGVPGGPYYNRTRYRAGLQPGRAPVNWGAWDPDSFQSGAQQRRIYFSQHIRLVDTGRGDWESQGVGTKLGFWAAGRCSGALNDLYTLLQGGTRSEFTLRMMQQNVTSRSMSQNRKSGAVMQVGRWHHWEMEMVLNDIGSSNGIFRWWVDGDLIMEYTDVVYRTSGNPCGFIGYKWNPTWGGTGGPDRSRDDFIDISDIRISGRPL